MVMCQIASFLMTLTSIQITSKIKHALPLFTQQYHSTNRVVKDFFVYLETRTTGENKFDFLIKSMDQLSRNVRLCQKNKTFLSISRDAT